MAATPSGAEAAGMPNPGLLMQLALAYRSSAVLFAALDLDIFSALARGPRTAEDIAAGTTLHVPALRLVLDACVAEGLLSTADGSYANTPLANAFLVRDSPAFSANSFKYVQNLYDTWGRLTDLVRQGTPPMPAAEYMGNDKARTRAFVLGMHERAKGIGSVLPHLVSLAGRKHLIDVGGGPGTYSVGMVTANPGLRSTVLDVPGVLEVSRELVDQSGVGDRITLMPGDYLTSPFGSGYDAALLSGMMHRETPDNCKLLLRKAFDALEPGGLVIVSDVFFDDDRKQTPTFAVYFALNMMLTSDHGSAHAKTEMKRWMEEVGFTGVDIKELPKPNPHTLLIGTRP